jgi:hypothetical protein
MAWTNLSKWGIKEKNPIPLGNDSEGAKIAKNIKATHKIKNIKLNFLLI